MWVISCADVRPVSQGDFVARGSEKPSLSVRETKPVSQEKKGGMFLVDCCRLLPEGQASGSGKPRPVSNGDVVVDCCQRV